MTCKALQALFFKAFDKSQSMRIINAMVCARLEKAYCPARCELKNGTRAKSMKSDKVKDTRILDPCSWFTPP